MKLEANYKSEILAFNTPGLIVERVAPTAGACCCCPIQPEQQDPSGSCCCCCTSCCAAVSP